MYKKTTLAYFKLISKKIISVKMLVLCYIVILHSILYANSFKLSNVNNEDCDHPLILTPYIEAGKVREAQKLAEVQTLPGSHGIKSYSGYFKVNDDCNSNIFFWYFPPESKNRNDPTIVWLQGGPGGSSLYGLFNEIGPFYLKDNKTLELQKYRWTLQGGLLFFDNPVCTGFSYTDKRTECYSHNENDVRKNLYNATVQFFQLFPKLQKNDFYIFGESYAGKYIPALAYTIHENKEKSKVKINLKGLGIGDGWCDPIHQINYSSFLFNIGILGTNEKEAMQKLEDKARAYIKDKNWKNATYEINDLLQNQVFQNYTGGLDVYNYIELASNPSPPTNYLNRPDIKCALHTGKIEFDGCNNVFEEMVVDFSQSVKPWVEELVEHYRIMFYNGMLDAIVAAVLTDEFIQNLKWSGASEYAKLKQTIYNDKDGFPYAYGKYYKNLAVIRVRNAGHMVPKDQPQSAFKILHEFLNGRIAP